MKKDVNIDLAMNLFCKYMEDNDNENIINFLNFLRTETNINFNECNKSGGTFLKYAVIFKNIFAINLLIDFGVNVSLRYKNYNTNLPFSALDTAISFEGDRYEIIEILLESGCQYDKYDIIYAEKKGPRYEKLLLKYEENYIEKIEVYFDLQKEITLYSNMPKDILNQLPLELLDSRVKSELRKNGLID